MYTVYDVHNHFYCMIHCKYCEMERGIRVWIMSDQKCTYQKYTPLLTCSPSKDRVKWRKRHLNVSQKWTIVSHVRAEKTCLPFPMPEWFGLISGFLHRLWDVTRLGKNLSVLVKDISSSCIWKAHLLDAQRCMFSVLTCLLRCNCKNTTDSSLEHKSSVSWYTFCNDIMSLLMLSCSTKIYGHKLLLLGHNVLTK